MRACNWKWWAALLLTVDLWVLVVPPDPASYWFYAGQGFSALLSLVPLRLR